ncbi:Dcm Site-specific DNA methylase [uncultured Caudovirales phage]|uniref:DNA (cytosine-5-)-methyltransferase n=1 Tax=uncultured Caudovirales phage TaxID=2100421 RepID=A0A6J5QW06_9CAUD|nr:Dcm Site-specific DNA methylase [uncultured Caudovirales phage]
MEQLNELALFAGAGGGILAGKLLGWRTVCAVEWEPYPASVLCARQNDGLLPPFPIWDDVQTFDGKPWAGIVDVVSGGFPCTDISAAGRGAGIDGEASGMWREMARIIYEVRPRFAFVENSPMLTSRGLGRVLGDLASMGFNARWGVLGAADVGANHQRDRIWIVGKYLPPPPPHLAHAHSTHEQRNKRTKRTQSEHANIDGTSELAYTERKRLQGQREYEQSMRAKAHRQRKTTWLIDGCSSDFWKVEPDVGRVADGVAARVDRLKAIGNGQVPLCAATAWRILNA